MTQTHKQMVIARRAQRRIWNNWLMGSKKYDLAKNSCWFSRLEN